MSYIAREPHDFSEIPPISINPSNGLANKAVARSELDDSVFFLMAQLQGLNEKLQAIHERVTAVERRPLVEYPDTLQHIYGYGAKAYNGNLEKAIAYTVSTSSELGRFAAIASAAVGDTYEFSFLLRAGSYNLVIVHDRGTSRGIVSFFLNDVSLGSVDCYATATAAVNRRSFPITLTTSGLQTFKARVLSKNSSSSGFLFNCSGIFVTPILVITEFRINCAGAVYVDSTGKTWAADQYFSGGGAHNLDSYLGSTTITNTSDPILYRSERSVDSGSFSYVIPITTGTYTLKLYFAENFHGSAGARVGSVSLNGIILLNNFDIFQQAGGTHKALVKTFSGLALSSFTLTFNSLLVNAIELLKTS